MEYDFTLRFLLPAEAASADGLIEQLGAAGCDDALVGIGLPGHIALNFTREAISAQSAIVSALEAVKSAIPGVKLLEAAPDFVGLTDIAELVGVSRQNMRKLMLSHREHFPLPIHEGSAAFWHLFPVLIWLKDRPGYDIAQPMIDVAFIAMQINLTKEARQIEHRVSNEVKALVA